MKKFLLRENINLQEAILVGEAREKVLEAISPTLPDNVKTILKEDNTAVIRVISQGWSYNKNYYTEQRLMELPKIVMTEAQIQFINHSEEHKFERDARELASYTLFSWYDSETKSTYAAVYFPKTKVDTAWMYEIIEQDPSKIGASISSYADVEEDYTAEGITGNFIKEWVDFQSFDYVLFPSAGGVAITAESRKEIIAEAKTRASESKLTEDQILAEAKALFQEIKSVKQLVADTIHRDYFWRVLYALEEVFFEVLFGDVKAEDRDTTLRNAFDEAYSVLSELPFVTNSNNTPNQESAMNLKEFKEKHPDLLDQLKAEILAEASQKDLGAEVTSLKDEVAELSGSLTKATETIESLKTTKTEVEAKLSQYQAAEKKANLEKEMESLLKKYELPAAVVTESLRNKLLAMDSVEALEAEIKERAEVIAAYKSAKPETESQTIESRTEGKPETQKEEEFSAVDFML